MPLNSQSEKLQIPEKNGVVHVVDDDEAIRDSLALLLNANGFKVSCHESAEHFLHALSSNDQQPIRCALLDIHLTGMSGIGLQDTLLAMNLHIPVAFISGHGEIASVVHALKRGAVDFIQKPIKEDVLCATVSTMLSKARLDHEQQIELEKMNEKFKLLSPREAQVLEHILTGRMHKQIGQDLGISIKTVEAHRAKIMEKLELSRPAHLFQVALRYQKAKRKS